ncbi:MAG TPA: cytochrome b/b6 domain-containing protein [Thermodesulfovibrionales bacterium]|nr:cytochrome b/b6 domain-containing protein [Thermodesulfovibrionales bacterium]
MTDTKPNEYLRFNLTFRMQHVIMLVTFLLLAFTGWSLKYPEPAIEHAGWWIRLWGGPKTAGIIHRIAGVTMLIDFVWHVAYLAYMLLTGKMKFDTRTTIVPLPQDVIDLIHNFLYFFGLSKTKPQFGRFSYIHKFDYWAVFWGMGIIGLSGLALAFPTKAQYFFPGWSVNWIWELLSVLHSDEALLAIVFILFWHFYNEHLKWDKFPMSMTWITGKIPMETFKHEHPLEYELELKENPDLSMNRRSS